jgi:hypothetical protein
MMMLLSGQKLSNFWPFVEAERRFIVVASLGLETEKKLGR